MFSAGFIDAGMTPLLALDVDKNAIASYRANVAKVGEIASVATYDSIPQADVLIAGPPCQGFSTLGRQDPTDMRNGLSAAIPRWTKASDCSVAVIENVPPFLDSDHWERLRDELVSQGFSVAAWVLDAVDYGTAQTRRRAFTVASKVGEIAPPTPLSHRVTAGEVLSRPIGPDDKMHTWPTPKGVAAQRLALLPPKGDKRDILAKAPHLCPPSWQRVGCQATDVWGRIDPSKPANTLRCTFQNPSKGRYVHPTENRTISLREGARLQGIPDSWSFDGRPYPIARQIGNGVPVPLAKAVAAQIALALDGQFLDLVAA